MTDRLKVGDKVVAVDEEYFRLHGHAHLLGEVLTVTEIDDGDTANAFAIIGAALLRPGEEKPQRSKDRVRAFEYRFRRVAHDTKPLRFMSSEVQALTTEVEALEARLDNRNAVLAELRAALSALHTSITVRLDSRSTAKAAKRALSSVNAELTRMITLIEKEV